MKLDFHTVAGEYLGSTETDAQEVSEGEKIPSTFDDQFHSEWEVVGATPPSNGVRKVIVTRL